MTTDPTPRAELPPGAVPIDTRELLAIIGELYVQVSVLRRQLAAGAAAASSPSFAPGSRDGAVQLEH